MIPVTKPFLPPKEEYLQLLDNIWSRNWLTNHGPLVSDLELKLKKYLQINHLLFVSNGTSALQLAIKALDLKGEILTTPFSYVATTTSIIWENCKPVFVDIDSETFTIDVTQLRNKITPKTTAILGTHVYGNPCDVYEIKKIADEFDLKVIYDGAHAFGVKLNGKSIFEFGDISTSSFHATKIFHTVEGGCVTTQDPDLLRKMSLLGNFGHTSKYTFEGIGINSKNSEFHAAMGICNLRYIEDILAKRKKLSLYYDGILSELNFTRQKIIKGTSYNYAYYPILLKDESTLLAICDLLDRNNIFSRRYFYPSLNSIHGSDHCPVSENISSRVLCLPLYYDLTQEEQDLVARLIIRATKYRIST